jgi:starvation-inducible DNA-binding protein
VDDIAERIRALDHKVPASFAFFDSNKTIEDPDENLSSTEMLKNLSFDYAKCHTTLKNAFDVAAKQGDEATVDLLVERMRKQDKDVWMIKSHYQD